MNSGCTAASPTPVRVDVTTTPPLNAAYRLGRRSRRSSSSGASSNSSGANGSHMAIAGPSREASASRKRRRHSTLSSGIASGSEEEGERAPPTFRLRLGSYVRDFRITRTRSQSPSSPLYQAAPSSPLGPSRQSHALRIQTTALSGATPHEGSRGIATCSPTLITPTPSSQGERDVEMDLDVQSTFQAMQVDSPVASPSPHPPTNNDDRSSFFQPQATAIAPFQPQALTSSLSLIPSNLLSPLNNDAVYPRSPSPASAPLPFSSLVAHSTVTAGVFPSQALLASSRRRPSSILPQHTPASPSPLARTISASAFASSSPQQSYPHFVSPSSYSQHQPYSTYPLSQSMQVQKSRSRSSSTPPSPLQDSQIPPSPVRRHSDGKPSPLRLHAP